jgi:hypothetical protein
LADALFVDLAGSRRDSHVEILRHGKCERIGLCAARRFPARRLRCSRYLRLQGLHPMSPILNQIRNARLSRPYGGVKDLVEDAVVGFVLTRTWPCTSSRDTCDRSQILEDLGTDTDTPIPSRASRFTNDERRRT